MRYPSHHRRPPIVLRSTSFRPASFAIAAPISDVVLPSPLRLRRRPATTVDGAAFSSHPLPPGGPATARTRELSLTLPIPPSINHQYATVNGRRLLSAHGRSYKAMVGQEVMIALSQIPGRRTILEALRTQDLTLCIRFFFTSRLRRDVDGGLKIAQDALCQGLGINDNRIVETHLYKHVDKATPRMEIRLSVASKA